MGLSLMVTVLGLFGPGPAEGRHGAFSTGGVVRRGDFDGIFGFGFGFMAFAT